VEECFLLRRRAEAEGELGRRERGGRVTETSAVKCRNLPEEGQAVVEDAADPWGRKKGNPILDKSPLPD